MRVLTALAAVLLAAACQKADAPAAPAPEPAPTVAPAEVVPAAAPTTTYGVVSEGPAITPAQALATLAANNGKTVRIAGIVSAVCPMRGCWMDIAGDGGETIRIKVKDGEVVFPPTAKGKRVIAEGVLVEIPADPADDKHACGDEGHAAGQHADCSRPAGARARLDGTGAVVSDAS
jgi:hypothetical protein